ncbi:hypothetical protein OFS07_12650 [Brachyspira hyodysenteriae]|uniref:tetratricopeptide repeat protein n=1 Tax=Brachyspira hyodysenteriae TaxID=159 RepID=UPI00063D907B|nr:hypothetical protein [Brachyspira hyodysenteriae]KLI29285.1 hypothetical protein SZ49_10530 [Brachyspira hyodysenteriae]MDA0064035.1 hypothetical protein [Brachyspira hyodysenteriae]MDA0067109.1 hypothetical protein [Brachyspira hyodysenteriae]MDA0072184.1 hypothetical protein [Brachyspira hyodysenteriae]MDA0090061.1 hypothetical protein [Brachyspira hyodysenteriae]
MEEEHNFIKNEVNYEPEIEKSSSNGVMLTIIFLILLIAGICYWIYNSNTYTKNYSYKNNIHTNTQLSNKNDILNRNNIKKNLDYLLEIKYKEYIAPHVNSFNSIIDSSGLLNIDTRTISIIFAGTILTIIASMFLFRGNNSDALESTDSGINFSEDSKNDNEDKKEENINKLDTSGIINSLDDDKKIIDTNNDGDRLVLKNNYYKYNKNGDNVYWNVIKKNKNDENLNINELSLMALREVENGNDDNAINIYTKILSFDDDNIAVLKSRALLFNKKYEETSEDKYFDAALKDYNKIIDINSFNEYSNTDTFKDRAVLYTKKYHYTSNENYFNLALNDYNRVVDDNNKEDLSTLLIYSDLYNEKYKNTRDKKYFNMSLDNYNKALNIDENNTSIYINRGWLYLTDYKICNDIESLDNAEKDIKHGLNLEKDNFYLLNNSGITSLYKYKLEKQVKDLKESEYSFLKSIKNNKSNSVLAESYYYLSLVYDEYSKLTTITAEKMKEYTDKSKHYFEESRKLGYSPEVVSK